MKMHWTLGTSLVNWSLSGPFMLPLGRVGPVRAQIGVNFAAVGWFRRFRPPSSGLVPCLSAFVFFVPCPFRVCPLWAKCVVLVFAPSVFFCVFVLASRLRINMFHSLLILFIFNFFHFLSLLICVCVCKYHLSRCETSTCGLCMPHV